MDAGRRVSAAAPQRDRRVAEDAIGARSEAVDCSLRPAVARVERRHRRFASPSLSGDANDVVTKLREYKLQNCGCVGVDVAFDENLGTPTVVDARMMFGSACVGKASKYEAIGAGAE